jgi:hypothetical protein
MFAPDASDEYDSDQKNEDEGDDPQHLHPTWRAVGRFAIGS